MNEGQIQFDNWPSTPSDEDEDITVKPECKHKRRSGYHRNHTISELSPDARQR